MMRKNAATAPPSLRAESAVPIPLWHAAREKISLGRLFSADTSHKVGGLRPALTLGAMAGALLLLAVGGTWVGRVLLGDGGGQHDPPIRDPALAVTLPTGGLAEETPTVEEASREDGSTEEIPTEERTAEEIPTEAITDSLGDGTDSVTEGGTDEPETDVPVGCIPIVSRDVSCAAAGVEHVTVDAGAPRVTPADGSFLAGEAPAVLILHTHPLEGYGDGGAWYDPSGGVFAQVTHESAPNGVVSLGVALTRALREQGITVIHLRVLAESGETAIDVYGRVEAAVADACATYPQIRLILDLRRSAELTSDGGILRTEGSYMGTCAQVGISVHGGRSRADEDLAVALSLRRCLWGMETSLSRPVRVKNGEGGASGLPEIPLLTLELGAAGNTYAEAEALISPVARALVQLLTEKS